MLLIDPIGKKRKSILEYIDTFIIPKVSYAYYIFCTSSKSLPFTGNHLDDHDTLKNCKE